MKTTQRAKALATKKGLKRVGFKKAQPKGVVYYTNPNARAVKGKYFGLENIESLHVRGFAREPWTMEELHGGNGAIAVGKVKFKGESKAKTVALKGYFRPNTALENHLKIVVQRLRDSKARHPKMCVFPLTVQGHKNLYLLMEPFFRMQNGQAVSKIEQTERVVNKIRLPKDTDTLRKVLNETAELAKAGLAVSQSLAVARDFIALRLPQEALEQMAHKQIDVFNEIKLKNGQTQILSQDIDELLIQNDPKKAWKKSIINITEVLHQQNHGQQAQQLLTQLIKETQKQHKL
jgi:hypothetical protein